MSTTRPRTSAASEAPATPGWGARGGRGGRRRGPVLSLAPGVAACVVALALAFGIHALLPSLPAMTLAVVLGIAAANLPDVSGWVGGSWQPGLRFAGKHLMRAGIVLLGLKLSLGDIAALGWQSFALIVAVVLLSFAGTYALGKLFKLPGDAPLLIATGFSICGASAIGAMAAVRGTKHQDTVLPVALVTLCGTLAIGTLPLLMHPLGLDAVTFGRWVGASVHDVGQVVAASQTAGAVALSAAVVIKLSRVVLLAPIVATAGLFERRRRRATAAAADHAGTFPPIVPLFVVGFLAMIAVRSLGWASPAVLDFGNLAQEIALGAALFGLGSSVRVRELLNAGPRSLVMALFAWALIAALGLGAVVLAG
ncbi:YeiH family protein [Paenarthrobacter sp. YJN-5]|uniref:YeiH family protein n=1 Tax=Paenarthrobacter sp. YJN-5 TaxID=2735316 RepID=UPI0018778D2D|nr:putative sulfate exporter family transporter [Paenarthrobacter sp. YJN-5]QOT18314.1 putative sulfate exporter family transporter [Paenarthrobacter sp. YJN-5]